MVCSATLTLLAPGALTTRTPFALAASRSTLSTPVPARATIRRPGRGGQQPGVDPGGAADDQGVGIGEVRLELRGRGRPDSASTVQPCSRRRSAADGGRGSAITIFMRCSLLEKLG